ncbi:LLM class flavin-dependent oxidoreductase [Mobilicoccus caccae]|uniref:Luciferase-like domain-containing protein n=1 Tax=Mobilicoccus caccae TaxID=1859295 RepID=A0ABQ6IQK3_9MICO|nr:LLM class flavin-dependent oxidoreductase [Mobilicoccus caccae]GMA39553.1 hypothetical protein GCM10025883_15980 [Mobilicoccus caccae]
MPTLRRALILPHGATPSDDIALTAEAITRGFDAVWVGERTTATATPRLAALAATTATIGLGAGLVPLNSRSVDHLEETLSTLSLLAPGRVGLAFALPTTLAGSARPSWSGHLAELSTLVRRAGIPPTAAVAEVSTATLAAEHVDRLVLRGASVALTAEITAALARREAPPQIEVWLDLAVGQGALDTLRPVVAERLAVPGVAGHATALLIARRDYAGLQADVESAYARGDLAEATRNVPDAFVEATCFTGGSEALTGRVRAYAQAGAAGVGVLAHGDEVHPPTSVIAAFAAAHDAADTDAA